MILATFTLALFAQAPEETPQTEPASTLPACVQEFIDGARARDADRLVAVLTPAAEITELHTLFELLGQAPFEFTERPVPFPNGPRALACVSVLSHGDNQLSEFWFWLEGEGAGQRIHSVLGDARYSRDWLYQTPKRGLAATPLEAATTLFHAMSNGDERLAERCASDVAWRADAGDLRSLFVTAHTTGLGFVTEPPVVRKDRAAITFGFEIKGQRQGEATLYLERRGRGWIATGFSNDENHTAVFLSGQVAGTVWPKSPFDAYQLFGQALQKKHWISMGSVCTLEYWDEALGRRDWMAFDRARKPFALDNKSVRIDGQRAVGTLEMVNPKGKQREPVYAWLADTPAGWRIIGHSQDLDATEQYLSAVEDLPQPK